MSGDIANFLSLITSEHADKPKYTSMVGISVQPAADLIALYGQIPLLYDVDIAIGEQLDVCGQWVGVSRYLDTPLAGVYFSFDTANVGFDQGVWKGPFDPDTGLVILPDYYYRILIKVRILDNHWDGSSSSAYTLANAIFSTLGYTFFIEDPSDLTMRLGLIGAGPPTALVQALLTSGKFNIKPIGVHISAYIYQQQTGPVFAFDLNTVNFAGFDTGAWAAVTYN